MTQTQNSQALRLSFEYFPVNTPKAISRLEQVVTRHAVYQPEFISITYGASGSSRERSLDTVEHLKGKTGLDIAAHLTTVGASRAEIMGVAKQFRDMGIRRIVALRGDKPKESAQFEVTEDGFLSSIEFIAALKAEGFDVSVGAYPETHPEAKSPEADLEFLKRKFDAGADRALTQFFFEKESFLRFRDRAVRAGIDKPIFPGILPIENFEKMASFAGQCGAKIPAWLADAYRNVQTKEARHLLSISIACDLIENLRAEGVEDVHIYTLNNAELTFDICSALGLTPRRPEVRQVA